MPTLTLEPRDAGLIEHSDILVAFESDLAGFGHGEQACLGTCNEHCTYQRCCYTLM